MPFSLPQNIVSHLQLTEPFFSKIKNKEAEKKGIQLSMLRLDAIHPIVSGNKIFKLLYFLEDALAFSKHIITFGGTFSNHLAATAFTAKQLNIPATGIVRGEKPQQLSPTLQFCMKQNMELKFISRSDYKLKERCQAFDEIAKHSGDFILIPEGGYSEKGMRGASLIHNYYAGKNYTHVCLPVGTATTFAGLINAGDDRTKIMGFGVLKNLDDIAQRLAHLHVNTPNNYSYNDEYHFGGYAKKNTGLLSFMESFFQEQYIELDFVYTAKLMFGVFDLLKKDYFEEGSKILCIHTGGLQGNQSLI